MNVPAMVIYGHRVFGLTVPGFWHLTLVCQGLPQGQFTITAPAGFPVADPLVHPPQLRWGSPPLDDYRLAEVDQGGASNEDCCRRIMAAFARVRQPGYLGFTDNSSTYIFELLRAAGFNPPPLPFWGIGYHAGLFYRVPYVGLSLGEIVNDPPPGKFNPMTLPGLTGDP